jgi:hypothetical protein
MLTEVAQIGDGVPGRDRVPLAFGTGQRPAGGPLTLSGRLAIKGR